MSIRLTLTGNRPGLTAVAGWDNAMNTYFAEVIDETAKGDAREILWLGSMVGEVRTPEEMVRPLAPYAVLDFATIERLKAERVKDLDRRPTMLQQWGAKFGR